VVPNAVSSPSELSSLASCANFDESKAVQLSNPSAPTDRAVAHVSGNYFRASIAGEADGCQHEEAAHGGSDTFGVDGECWFGDGAV
jgi:hypothetical protein